LSIGDIDMTAPLARALADATASPHETLLVPLDGSPAAESILPAAIALVKRLPARISLLHVIERNAPSRVHGERHLTDESEAEAYLAGIAERIAAEDVPVAWHVHVVPVGNVPLSIAAHAADHRATLILLSAHGRGDPRTWLTGAVGQGVIRHATPPVLLLRHDPKREAPFNPGEVTVALDTEGQGEAALGPALRLARALHVPLRLLIVVPTVETVPGDQAAAARLLPSGAAAALDVEATTAAEYLTRLANRLNATATGVTVIPEIARGDPAQVMTDVAQARSGILALATHGRSGFDALWSGSIGSRAVARGAGPLLLVHPEPASATKVDRG
jgi:nucleotide-binding universal stress UspA family protein